MKCEFNINGELLEMTVTIPKRESGRDERLRVGRSTAYELAKGFKCPSGVSLGECKTPNLSLDNGKDKLEDVWIFKLNKSTKKATATKKSTKKPAAATNRVSKKTTKEEK